MDIEFHYYVNYILALRAGLLPDVAHKIAYSAQYVDDNTEHRTVLKKQNLTQYTHIITQSLNPTLSVKDIISIYPIFHFIPGDEILHSSSLRRDGECRYMTTIPDSRLARHCMKTAIQSKNPYWIGIASHAYADTWAHQNFTGLKDIYNCVDAQKTNGRLSDSLIPYIGHANVLQLPDSPGCSWYDYRLKEMQIFNCERFLEAAKNLFKMYVKYADSSMVLNKPKKPELVWYELSGILKAIFKNDLQTLESVLGKNCGFNSRSTILIMRILGLNKVYRTDIYMRLAKQIEEELGIANSSFRRYDKNHWFNAAVYEISDSIESYNEPTNDNQQIEFCEEAVLCDSAKAIYGSDIMHHFKNKLSELLGIYKRLYMWKNDSKHSDWYEFQEAAKHHHDYMIDKVIRIMRKDIIAMKRANG